MTDSLNVPALVWENPPARKRAYNHWADVLAPLTERPNEWARVAKKPTRSAASSAVSTLRTRHAGFEFEFGERFPDEWYVYARFVGVAADD